MTTYSVAFGHVPRDLGLENLFLTKFAGHVTLGLESLSHVTNDWCVYRGEEQGANLRPPDQNRDSFGCTDVKRVTESAVC